MIFSRKEELMLSRGLVYGKGTRFITFERVLK